jgi:hypothetical protein
LATILISDDDLRYRRLAPGHADDFVANSGAYSGNGGLPEVSVNLARLTTPEETLKSRPDFGLGELKYGDVIAAGFEVEWDPVEGNQAHCLIRGDATKTNSRALAKMTRVVKMPHRSDSGQTSRT